MTLKNAIFTSSGAPRDFRHREIDSTPSRPPESGRIWAALTRKGEPYGESQLRPNTDKPLEGIGDRASAFVGITV